MGEKAKEALKLQWYRDQRGTRSAHYELIWEISVRKCSGNKPLCLGLC